MSRRAPKPTRAAPLRALALVAALALVGCGGAPTATVPPTARVAATSAQPPALTPPGGVGRVPAAQQAQADLVLRALGTVAAGQVAPPDLRPEVADDLRLLIDQSNRTPRRCLTEFTVVGAATWEMIPVSFVPLLDAAGTPVAGSCDDGVRLTTRQLEGYKTVLTFQGTVDGVPFPDVGPATPTALPAGSPCAPNAPATPLQVTADQHRALRGEALVVLVEFRDGAWVATEAHAAGTGLP